MPKFKYVTRDDRGAKIEDDIESKNLAAARQALKRMGITVISITEVKKSLFSFSNLNKPKPRAKASDLVIFTRQFSTMIEAGLPVVEILDILNEQTDDPGFKLAVSEVRASVRGGADLSTAMSKFPTVFTPLYINLLKAGEASGDMDVILKRLAVFLEKNASLKGKIKSAMVYPCVSLALVLLITTGLLIFIVPMFQEIFDKLGSQLPLPTRVVVAISDALLNSWYLVGGGMVGLFLLLKMVMKSPRGRYFMDKMKHRAPVFGDLFQKVAISRFARTFSTMLRSGVPMLGSLDIVAGTAGNGVVEEAVMAAKEAVRQGEGLSIPLSDCPV
ncbi:MAG: type II secretion system F family protein, partial [Planctomycetota bacterium]|nr:type II secretion system F family protein [Planctomycetota bacterium]